MNLVGAKVVVLTSKDPTKQGRSGLVLLETSKTLVLQEDTGKVRVEKKGSTFMFISSKAVVSGDEITGRLEDRWGRTN
ncbi:MAG TPA: ribonuclease P protein subunit [Nitrososphaerales archaeon]|nr:ribonuclease P protein subunit [Nitrososphaerales archaeon]